MTILQAYRTALLVLLVIAAALPAEETRIQVRAVADDAKLIGDLTGGARITIRAVEDGRVLAQGRQQGSTGKTEPIMIKPRERYATVFNTEGAAGYLATVDIDEPTEVEIEALGPLDYPQAYARAVRRLWLLPGRHVEGEGIVLTLTGLIIEAINLDETALVQHRSTTLHVRLRMLCGCPTEPGGLWDFDGMSLTGMFTGSNGETQGLEFTYSGVESEYTAEVTPDFFGRVALEIHAFQPATGNAGYLQQSLHILDTAR